MGNRVSFILGQKYNLANTHPCLSKFSLNQIQIRTLILESNNPIRRESETKLTFSGSLLRQEATKSLKVLVKSPSSSGGLFLGIRKSTLIGCRPENIRDYIAHD